MSAMDRVAARRWYTKREGPLDMKEKGLDLYLVLA